MIEKYRTYTGDALKLTLTEIDADDWNRSPTR